MIRKLLINNKEIEVDIISSTPGSIRFLYDNKEFFFERAHSGNGKLILKNSDNRNCSVYSSNGKLFDCSDGQFTVQKVKKTGAATSAAGNSKILSPLPGKVIKVSAKQGQSVKTGDEILRIEAMKMEHRICAEVDGTLTALSVKPGDNVIADEELGEVKNEDKNS